METQLDLKKELCLESKCNKAYCKFEDNVSGPHSFCIFPFFAFLFLQSTCMISFLHHTSER